MGYQMLCIDVDGTLLNSKGEISDANRNAVKAAVAAGKKVVLCSGRTWFSLRHYEEILGLNVPGQYGIGLNGGAVYEHLESGETHLLHSELMAEGIAQEIFATLAPVIAGYDEMHMLAYNCEGRLVTEEAMRHSDLYDEMRRLGARLVPTFADIKGDVYKILIHGEHDDLLRLKEFVSDRFDGRCQTMFSAHRLLELIPVGVDKGLGVKFLSDYLGIPMEEIITLGDEANDIAMLRAGGLGIAVGNAVPSAVEAADVHLPESNDRDAVSAVINKYLL
jgi:hypothetical protein